MDAHLPQTAVTLTPDQEEAEQLIEEWFFNLSNQIFVLCGYAGTGKTFLIDHAVRRMGLVAGESAVFVAPTGKAASVLIRGGTPAGTVHSLIYMREEDIEVDENGEVISERFLRFVKKPSIDGKIRLIIVDETSMVADDVLKDLLSFGVKCLFCGDPAQLPPVGGSNSLLDMPCATLTQIVRQEENDPIVRLALAVRSGEYVGFGEYGHGVAVVSRHDLSPAMRKQLFLKADQIIVGTNRTRSAVNREMRAYLGIAPEARLPLDGEKLICTLNDWGKTLDKAGNFHLVNGIIGKCFRVRESGEMLGLLDFQADFLADKVYDLPFDAGYFLNGSYAHGYGEKAYLLEDGTLATKYIDGLVFDWEAYTSSDDIDVIRPAASAIAEFDEIECIEIRITISPATEEQIPVHGYNDMAELAVSEIRVLGK